MLHIQNLAKKFGENSVLTDLSATFEEGKIYAVLGRNGSGKTTLFNCISQEIPVDSGTMHLDDRDFLSDTDVGYVYATPMLPEFLTGFEFLSFFVEIHPHLGLNSADIEQSLDRIQFSEEDRHKLIRDYSLGMRNKLQMISILMLKPRVLLLDEPLTSFDLIASLEIKNLLLDIKSECIMLFSTHILQIARDLSDACVILHNGKLQTIPHEQLMSENFETDIIDMLSEYHEN